MMRLASMLGAALSGWAVLALPSQSAAAEVWPPLKITTLDAGLHHVTAASVAAVTGMSSNDVRDRILEGRWLLLNQGRPGHWLAGRAGEDLVFYAEAVRNNYTSRNVYWLVEGTNPVPVAVDGGMPAAGNTWYFAATNCEQDLYCRYELGTHPDSNYWFWANLVAGHRLRGKYDVAVPLDVIADTSAPARLSVRVHGATAATNTVGLAINGTTNTPWVGAWSGLAPAVFSFDIPSSLLHAGNNTVRFIAQGTPLTQWWLDGFVLEFPRPYAAAAGALQCAANSNAVITLTGFDNDRITVLDVSDPQTPLLVTNLLVEPNGGGWRASFRPAAADARYSVAQDGSLLEPLAVEAVWPMNLASSTNRAACVIIAPAALRSSAAALADYRNAQGLETRVIPLEAIHNEFGGGRSEPEALRAFLARAYNTWRLRPAYAVLAGNGTYDYRHLLDNDDNLVPPLMVPTLYGLTASDSEFGDFGGLDAPQVAVGRLSATNAAQLDAMIEKIKTYEALPPTANQALLVADFADPVAGDFPSEIMAVREVVAPAFQTTTVLPSTEVQMHNQVLAGLNSGVDLMCYLGHGASTQFGGGSLGYLSIADLETLNNAERLPFIVGITCLAGSFAEPGSDCLGQAFVSGGGSGAIAVLSTSGYSIDYEAVELNWALMTSLAGSSPDRLGDHIRRAMVDYNQTGHFTPSAMFNLLGDPALRLRSSPWPPPVISAVTTSSDQGCLLTVNATPGRTYALLTATNLDLPLASWSVVSTGTVPPGPFVLADPAATNSPQRFYRIGSPCPALR